MEDSNQEEKRNYESELEGNSCEPIRSGDTEETLSNRKQRMLQLKAQKAEKNSKGKKGGKKEKETGKDIINSTNQESDRISSLEEKESESLQGCNASSSGKWNHDEMPTMEKATSLTYCGVCGMPPDYCEFGEQWSECKKWIIKNCPQYLPETEITVEKNSEEVDSSPYGDNNNSEEVPHSGDSATIPTKNSRKQLEFVHKITIQRQIRSKKKIMTVVRGLENFGVKLNAATKLFSKQFACGSTVVKGAAGQPSQIEIQGDVEDELPEVLEANFTIQKDHIIHLPPK